MGWGGQRTTAGYSLMLFFFILSSAFAQLNLFEFKNCEPKDTQKPASNAGYSIKSFWMQNSTNRGALGSTHPALHISHNAPYFSPKFCITFFHRKKNNRFPFLDILGYLKNTHPKFGRVRQVPIRELGWEFPGWGSSHFAKFGIFIIIIIITLFV